MIRFFPIPSYLKTFFFLFLNSQVGVAAAAQITVSWTDNSVNEDGFKIERKTGVLLSTYVQIATTAANVSAFLDTTVNAGTTYCYRVRAYNTIGNSAYSNDACCAPDTTAPTVSITAPIVGATISGIVTVTASASDLTGVAGVQFLLDGVNFGSEVTTSPYAIPWDSTATANGSHTLSAIARDTTGNQALSTGVTVTVNNQPGVVPTGGLALAYSFAEGTGTAATDASGNNRNGAIVGATWTTAGKYTNGLSFDGGAARVTSGLNTQATVRTYLLWTKRTGPGGGSLGRIFDKRTNSSELEVLYNDEVHRVYRYIRAWSGGEGHWTIPQPSLNVWHYIAVVYDASLPTNSPQIYVDGIAQPVIQESIPIGTPLTNTDPYVIGNRGSGDRGWSGILDDLRVYDVALTTTQIQAAMAIEVAPPAPATPAPSTPSATPGGASVAYNFDEGTGVTVMDLSGNGLNGTIAGATWTASGKYGKALSFNGSTAKVTSGLSTHATVRSYLLWTNRTGAGGGSLGRIFDKRTSSGEVEAFYNDDVAGVYRFVRRWSGGVGIWTIPQPSVNVWHHIAVVYDASLATNDPKIYVDGVAQVVSETGAPSGTPLTNTDLYVFGNRGAGDRGWSGMLDDLRIYDIALTVTQIQATMATPVSLLASVAYNFDEGTGTTVTDMSGNSRNGTVAGATWTTAGKSGNALSFNGGTAKVTSGLSTHATVRSYLLWTNRTGPGGGSLGRILDKRTSGSEVEVLYNDNAAGVYRYVRTWSGGVGSWSIPQPSANVWHHIAVIYDASLATNKPQMYIDGVAQVVTQLNAPSGMVLTNTDPYILGNRGAGDRGWSGVLDDLRIYDTAVTTAQVQAALTTAVSFTTALLGALTGTSSLALPTTTTTTTSPTPTSASVLYTFDEGAGTTVADTSGNNWDGTIVGAPWTTASPYGNALFFAGGADKVTSGLTIHATARSYLLWTNRTGAGGGNFGRIFDKRTDGSEVELLFNDEAAGKYRYVRVWSGGVGNWSIPQPRANEWHHIAVVYDASSATNLPQMYIDGVAQVVTQETAPIGAPLTNTDPYVFGNRGVGDRGWSGTLDELQIYDTVLTAEQIQAAMTGAVVALSALTSATGTETVEPILSAAFTAARSEASLSQLASSDSALCGDSEERTNLSAKHATLWIPLRLRGRSDAFADRRSPSYVEFMNG